MREFKIGAPGFILVDELKKDFAGTCKKLGEIGFDGLEITGFHGHSATEIRKMCEDAGIEAFGCFALTPFMLCEGTDDLGGWEPFREAMEMPGKTPDEQMEYIKEMGCKYIGLCMTNEPVTDKDLDNIRRLAELTARHGLTLQYHNHDWEYINMINREYRMDYILKNIPEIVNYEPDLGWMAIGGYSPMKALEKYKNRIEIVHLKDYSRPGNDPLDMNAPYEFKPTGYGVMDWYNILTYCEKEIQPKWYVADHDRACRGDIFEELKASYDYIKTMTKYL